MILSVLTPKCFFSLLLILRCESCLDDIEYSHCFGEYEEYYLRVVMFYKLTLTVWESTLDVRI